ncbi:HNH endonuclease signature motif containing protein [Natrinema sp. DC36]|uniref:HNH endonuclease signature motif containing protein n=1 Tax=Natrinema sp. DC36 TaxID=2878680 RepID=UPI001CEFE4C0|nr:HNH endonuclease signature motif containing protein [Natrinema sp. DC36]
MRRELADDYQAKFWGEHDKDEYECPDCGRNWSEAKQFDVHHIDGNVGNSDMENLIGLCRRCHLERHGYEPGKRRGHWSEEYLHEWRSNETPLKYLQ